MSAEDIAELKREMYYELKQEAYEEQLMRSDFEYACEKLGLADIHDEIKELADKLCDYGYDVSIGEVMDKLMEI